MTSISAKVGVQRIEDGKVIGVNIENLNLLPHFVARPQDIRPSFENYIDDKVKNFVGREFIFDTINEFLINNSSGFFEIRGEPGIGKSAVMAYLVKTYGCIHHFNIALQSINKPRQFFSNVCAQLIALSNLSNIEIPEDAYDNGAFLNKILAEVSKKLAQDEKLMIVVDALDEVDIRDLPGRANPLFFPISLPKGIFIIVSSRNRNDIRLQVSNLKTLYLEAESTGNIKDVREYIHQNLSDPLLSRRLTEWNVTPQYFTEALIKKSEGNFMYLRHVLPAIREGNFINGAINDLPDGLLNYYRGHWAQMKASKSNFDIYYKPIVCMLASVKEAVTISHVSNFTGIEPAIVLDVVKEWLEFLDVIRKANENLYRVYHTTFQEYLCEEVDPGLLTYNRMIVNYYLKLAGKLP